MTDTVACENPKGVIIEFPDGYNGHTEIFYSEPIGKDDVGRLKLRCARPGAEYMIKWVTPELLEQAIYQAKNETRSA